jgi:hypothetical protein
MRKFGSERVARFAFLFWNRRSIFGKLFLRGENMKKIDGVEYLTLKEVSSRMGYGEQHLRNLCHKGKCSCLRRGRMFLFTEKMAQALAPKPVSPSAEGKI